MPPQVKKTLSDEEILRLARVRVSESAAATFTQVSLDTQLSVDRGVIWMIHFIEFFFQNVELLGEVAAAGNEQIVCQITRESKTGIVTGNDSDVVQMEKIFASRSAAIGTDAGPLWLEGSGIRRYDFTVPLPYAAQNIYAGILGTDASAAHTVDIRIGYTIRQVTDQFFFRVASALIG